MSFPPFCRVKLSFHRSLTQLCHRLLTSVISPYICALKTHICTRYLARKPSVCKTGGPVHNVIFTSMLSNPNRFSFCICIKGLLLSRKPVPIIQNKCIIHSTAVKLLNVIDYKAFGLYQPSQELFNIQNY